MTKFRAVCYICLLLTGCTLDHDDQYFPESSGAIFLVENGGDKSLYWLDSNVFVPDWHQALGISSVSDIGPDEEGVWVSSGDTQSLYFLPAEESPTPRMESIAPLNPHFIGVGATHLLIGDTLEKKLGFYSKKKEKMEFEVSVSDNPGQITYRSQKFYVQIGQQQVSVFHEKAFALLDSVSFRFPIQDIQLNSQNGTVVHTLDSVLYTAEIDYNTNQISKEETAVTYQKIRLSPFIRQRFGKEWLADVFLTEVLLTYGVGFPGLPDIDDFTVDFFDARLFIQQNDSLKVWDMATHTAVQQFPFSKNIVKSHYNIVPKGE